MGNIYNVEDIKRILGDFSKKAGKRADLIPIIISSRMKKSLASFTFKMEKGLVKPIAFKFSLKLLSGDFKEEDVINTVGHEYAHFYVNTRDNVNHGHNRVFKDFCKKIGVPEDTLFKGDYVREVKKGYVLVCKKCGKRAAYRRRRDVAFKIAKSYLSSCCREKMYIIEDLF